MIKKALTVGILNVVLPTVDVFTDLSFIIYLFDIGHFDGAGWYSGYYYVKQKEQSPKYAIALLFFFLLNYVMSFLAWLRYEEKSLKTLIVPFLNLYPQFCKQQSFDKHMITIVLILFKFKVGQELSKSYGTTQGKV